MEQSVNCFFKMYLQRSVLRPASIDIKSRACKFFLAWFGRPMVQPDGETINDLAVGEVTVTMALDYRTMLGKDRTPVSVNGYLNNFRAFWSWLRKHAYIPVDPFAFVGPVPVDEAPPRATFTAAELGRIMAVAEPLEQIQVCLGLLGARRGEMLAVQVGDVVIRKDGHGAYVEPAYIALGPKTSGKRTLPWKAKNHKVRWIAIPVAMAFDGRIVPFRRLVEDRMAELGNDPEAYLCVPLDRIQARLAGNRGWNDLRDVQGNHPRSFRGLQDRAGIRQRKRFHELRAAFITSMLDAVDSARVAEMVGHASVQQTRKYDRKTKLSLVAQASEIASKTYISKVS